MLYIVFVIFQTLLPTKQSTDRFTVDEARENAHLKVRSHLEEFEDTKMR
jgi:hypothetical protein